MLDTGSKLQVAYEAVTSVGEDGSTSSWSLLRVDVRKLELTVGHHFDYTYEGSCVQMNQASCFGNVWRCL